MRTTMARTSRNWPPRAVNKTYSRGIFWSERPDSILSVTLQFLPNSFAWRPRDRRARVSMIADLRTPCEGIGKELQSDRKDGIRSLGPEDPSTVRLVDGTRGPVPAGPRHCGSHDSGRNRGLHVRAEFDLPRPCSRQGADPAAAARKPEAQKGNC